jgi:glycosyltransferase domain-containing protein
MNSNKFNDWFKSFTNKKKKYNLKKNLNLTVVIFSYRRPECILRSVVFWSNKLVKILLIDGSEKVLNKNSRNIIKKIKNISYFHLPYKSISQRINFGISKSKTKYTMCQGDDDFYLISGLNEAIKKLEKKKSFIACMGQSLGLDFINRKPYFFDYGENLINFTVKSKDFIKRLNLAFKNYLPSAFYAVFKTKNLKNIWSNIQTMSCQELYEYEHAFRTFLEGSLITTKKKYWVRSFQFKPKSGKVDGNRKNTFSKWLKSSKFEIEREALVRRLSLTIQTKGSLTNENSKNYIRNIFNLIRDNKNSLYKNDSFFFSCFVTIKKILERTPFSKYLNKFKKTIYGVYLIEKINYLNRKKLISLKHLSKSEINDIRNLIKFLKDYPI